MDIQPKVALEGDGGRWRLRVGPQPQELEHNKGGKNMTQSAIKLTFEEYLKYDDGTDKRYEYEDGGLLEMPPATGLHEQIMFFLAFQFQLEIQRIKASLHARSAGIEVKTFRGKKPQSRKPDVSVITEEQNQIIRNTTAILSTPPPLVVEVVSPESVKRDYERKRQEYEAFGIGEYWIVDPLNNQVIVLSLEEGFYKERSFTGTFGIESPLFPDLRLTADQVLAS